ncbi:MAG: ABC transporter substrate-binding protein, partial [Gammaproteobacteria bacterium]|nr:ABC transporter substrate-binding protein [Gammaproteobacteria bacterium]
MTLATSRRSALKTLTALTAASWGLAACSRPDEQAAASAAATAPPAASNSKIVEFLYPDNPSFDLIYLADRLGYFEGTSTRPKYVGKVAAPQIIPLVGTGDIHFGARMVPLVISAIASGADMKVVAAGGKTLQEAPHMKYFVKKSSGIRQPKDLEGKTIGFNSFGACAEFVTKKYLR